MRSLCRCCVTDRIGPSEGLLPASPTREMLATALWPDCRVWQSLLGPIHDRQPPVATSGNCARAPRCKLGTSRTTLPTRSSVLPESRPEKVDGRSTLPWLSRRARLRMPHVGASHDANPSAPYPSVHPTTHQAAVFARHGPPIGYERAASANTSPPHKAHDPDPRSAPLSPNQRLVIPRRAAGQALHARDAPCPSSA